MSKTLNDLMMGGHLPADLIKKMENTEPGMLAKALDAMVYDRSHDDKMRTVYPERVYLGLGLNDWMAERIGCDATDKGASYGRYIKSDVVIAKVIALLDALSLQYALENR